METGYLSAVLLSASAACPVAAGRAGVEEVGRVDDGVGVALFGEEALPVGGVVGVAGVAGHDRVDVALAAAGLGAQDPTEALGFLLAAPERARHATATAAAASGRSMEKLAILETTRRASVPWRKAS
jgi:hypothetical protein